MIGCHQRYLVTCQLERNESSVQVGLVEAFGAVRVERLDQSCHPTEIGGV